MATTEWPSVAFMYSEFGDEWLRVAITFASWALFIADGDRHDDGSWPVGWLSKDSQKESGGGVGRLVMVSG